MFAPDLTPRQPAPRDRAAETNKAIGIRCVPVVVAGRLLVQIPKQMNRLNADVRAMQAAL
jgi:hypothetical protein